MARQLIIRRSDNIKCFETMKRIGNRISEVYDGTFDCVEIERDAWDFSKLVHYDRNGAYVPPETLVEMAIDLQDAATTNLFLIGYSIIGNGLSKCSSAFVSVAMPHLTFPKNFYRAEKMCAHEVGHTIGIKHHVYTGLGVFEHKSRDGLYCVMYTPRKDDDVGMFLDKSSLYPCKSCYSKLASDGHVR